MVKGVEVHKGRVRIAITWQGRRVYETTEFKPTASGLAAAGRLRKQIHDEIKYGTFLYRHYFPNSPRAQQDTHSFYELAKRYIAQMESSKSASTVTGYRKMVNNYWLPIFEEAPIATITTGHIRDAIVESGLADLSKKTLNNAMTPLRGIFELAMDYEVILRNPCDKIKWERSQRPLPDPLDMDEIQMVLDAVQPHWRAYFEVAFGTGMRTSELIELRWTDIDWNDNTITVSRAYVNQETKGTKTHKVRVVSITDMAAAGLRRQKAATFLAGDLVFLASNGQQLYNDKPPRIAWNFALKKAGIRHRKAYSTRHTFASHALVAGVNPYVVAEQLGNSVDMLMKHYAKWIRQSKTDITDIYPSASTSASKQRRQRLADEE